MFNIFRFNHWELRVQAAESVAFIAKMYGTTYTTLLPRVTKTLAKALVVDSSAGEGLKPLSTHYGAIVALSLLGPLVIDSVLLPILEEYMRVLPDLEKTSQSDAERVMEAWRNAISLWREHFGKEAPADKIQSLKKLKL